MAMWAEWIRTPHVPCRKPRAASGAEATIGGTFGCITCDGRVPGWRMGEKGNQGKRKTDRQTDRRLGRQGEGEVEGESESVF